jgi:predicted outer membrane repeat protein
MSRRQRRRREQRRRHERRRRLAAGTGIALGAALVAPGVGHATDFTVTSSQDPSELGKVTLRDAINSVNADALDSNASPDRILFQSGLSGTITLASSLPQITRPVAIDGPGAPSMYINGANKYPIFVVSMGHAHDDVTISGLWLKNGYHPTNNSGGAIDNTNGTLVVANTFLTSNRAYDADGGAIFTNGPTTIENSAVAQNRVNPAPGDKVYGAGVESTSNAPLTIVDSSFLENNAFGTGSAGGGIRSLGPLTIENSKVIKNTADDGAGVESLGSLTLTGSTITGNIAEAHAGGGLDAMGSSPASIESSTISGNTAPGDGGGVSASAPLTISESTIGGNRAEYGGGIAAAGRLTLTGSAITGNAATSDGGGIDAGTATASIATSTISGNTSGAKGGGARISEPATIDRSAIFGNFAASDGGGLHITFGDAPQNPATLTNSTISGNTSFNLGGGIYGYGKTTYAEPSRHIALDSVTIADNFAADDGGGIAAGGSVSSGTGKNAGPSLTNTIVATNSAGMGGQDLRLLGTRSNPFATAFSLIENAPPSSFVSAPSDVLGIDPQLQPLAWNGGSTQTMALASTSQALDKGSTALTTDQRGLPRPDPEDGPGGPTDIGAFETQSPIPPAPGVGPPQPPPASPPPPAAKLTFSGKPKVSGGSVKLSAACGPGATCNGVATETSAVKTTIEQIVGIAARTHRKSIAVGSTTFSIAAGRTATITIRLNARGRALLRRFGRLPVNISVLLSQLNGRAGVAETARVTFHKRRRRRR